MLHLVAGPYTKRRPACQLANRSRMGSAAHWRNTLREPLSRTRRPTMKVMKRMKEERGARSVHGGCDCNRLRCHVTVGAFGEIFLRNHSSIALPELPALHGRNQEA